MSRIYDNQKDGPAGMGLPECEECPITARLRRAELALKAGEETQLRLFDRSRDAIVITGPPSWRFVYANPAALELFRVGSLSEFLKLQPWDLSPDFQPDGRSSRERAMELVTEAMDGTGFSFEWRHRRTDGSLMDCFVRFGRIGFEGRDCLHGTVTDVSERNRAASEAQRTRIRDELILEGAGSGIWDWDLSAGAVEYSARWKAMRGCEGQSIAETIDVWLDGIHADDSARIRAAVRRCLEGLAATLDEEYRILRSDGTYLWVRGFGKVLHDDGGTAVRMAGSEIDITERKTVEIAHDSKRQRLASMLKATRAGTWEFNFETGETRLDDRWAGMIGYALEELMPITADTWKTHCHPEDYARSGKSIEAHLRGETDFFECEVRMKHKNGGWVWVHDTGSVVSRSPVGDPILIMGAHLDISARKNAELESEKLRNEINQIQRLESLGRLAGGVAHDYNNMLGVILANVDMAMPRASEIPALLGNLADIRNAAEHSADLTRKLLAFARKQAVAPEVIELDQAIDSAFSMIERVIGEDVEVLRDRAPEPIRARIDVRQIEQILVNLCVNAKDALGERGRITIGTRSRVLVESYTMASRDLHPGRYGEISVSDNGCGMEPEILRQIFDPFFTTKEVGRGTGLGLPSVDGIVRQNGGTIEVESAPGKGTVFRILLPCCEDAAHNPEPVRTVSMPSEDRSRRHECRILVVEDEPALRRILAIALKQMGYRVIDARDPEAALRMAEDLSVGFDLLITDMVMPMMSGAELARRITGMRPEVKVLFMSGYAPETADGRGQPPDFGCLIQKPFMIGELDAKVSEVLAATARRGG